MPIRLRLSAFFCVRFQVYWFRIGIFGALFMTQMFVLDRTSRRRNSRLFFFLIPKAVPWHCAQSLRLSNAPTSSESDAYRWVFYGTNSPFCTFLPSPLCVETTSACVVPSFELMGSAERKISTRTNYKKTSRTLLPDCGNRKDLFDQKEPMMCGFSQEQAKCNQNGNMTPEKRTHHLGTSDSKIA